ncbi:hypothetical protein A3F00_05160 [Candidatus Daviesbacteria bacterium RIFCSPHIGHO2_12_FULL_37_11]|uniref:DUF5671 domain-containing protein n=1 Tax=Candidatus Daviesbacteria bacterium RIFCSPHIGHO2_12_FULL_37_11 TaxID=1797777 RepID=A0A1F5K9G4_9BACT|nr:MAG: hypothetical protein A2111_01110 [Candidatus Daviesbacteria bacterium GWA1_38_6]OGE17616.1 MAG: hypothetical protein A2769_02590 [Candidatus Daviesbacteria bacterium RIFCSPHIGHO2_01_FULL_37_27]OGE37547.1 MAG: hypothetical protein A3F00_05160 [Candidatus Daviesbacteria bacterium RIFCSPHIGHO2_12_FULL_37_11]OGE46328.1 MAG: hypothetical protein A3B39_03125 [Candidatus Daviesbacteria bacterium RIFCSPLOWO2_01_FULL_37_10]
MKKEKLLTNFAIVYFILGLFFATIFAIYYKWEALSFLSPGFYAVVLTWPFQFSGLLQDFLTYGLAGKPI